MSQVRSRTSPGGFHGFFYACPRLISSCVSFSAVQVIHSVCCVLWIHATPKECVVQMIQPCPLKRVRNTKRVCGSGGSVVPLEAGSSPWVTYFLCLFYPLDLIFFNYFAFNCVFRAHVSIFYVLGFSNTRLVI